MQYVLCLKIIIIQLERSLTDFSNCNEKSEFQRPPEKVRRRTEKDGTFSITADLYITLSILSRRAYQQL